MKILGLITGKYLGATKPRRRKFNVFLEHVSAFQHKL
jgi:hypothetical protein